MFHFQETANLQPAEAKKALTEPLKKTPYSFEGKLVSRIVNETNGYPYFLQFYGYYLTETIKEKITLKDFENKRKEILERLDRSFFEDRFNMASDGEKKVLLAMSKIQTMEVNTAEIGAMTNINYNNLMQLLIRLTDKGLIYRIKKGRYAFTMPLFREYLKRRY